MNFLRRNKWLLARRFSQLGFLALFLTGPWFGVWITKGTLADSLTLDLIPLTDPFIFLQSLVAGHWPVGKAALGAALVLGAYGLLRGRLYCAWVCPVNVVTDAAAWTRRGLGLREGMNLGRRTRWAILLGVLAASAATGTIAWESVNPVTFVHRALVFGGTTTLTAAALIAAGLFLFDTGVALHGWCGHLCPVGAFYGLVGRWSPSLVRVAAPRRAACDDCRLCYHICPEPHVLTPALKGDGPARVTSADCTACGRCADVCPHDVFALGIRRPFFKEN